MERFAREEAGRKAGEIKGEGGGGMEREGGGGEIREGGKRGAGGGERGSEGVATRQTTCRFNAFRLPDLPVPA